MFTERRKHIVAALLIIAFISYSFFLYVSLPVKDYSISLDTNEGKLVWQQYNCNACHQVYGLGGYLGPDLTNTYTLKGPAYIKAFLQNGTAIMPKFDLKGREVIALLAYLQNIAASGKADPRTFKINTNGTIQQ